MQELVLKYRRWNLKRSFYYFGGFPAQSWVRLIIFLSAFLFLVQNKATHASFLEKVKNYFFKQLSFTVCGAQKKYKGIQKD